MDNLKKVALALAIVKDSEKLLIGLRFSMTRSTVRDLPILGLYPYLKATKRTLQINLIRYAFGLIWSWLINKIR
jgi:hypothetical protein